MDWVKSIVLEKLASQKSSTNTYSFLQPQAENLMHQYSECLKNLNVLFTIVSRLSEWDCCENLHKTLKLVSQ